MLHLLPRPGLVAKLSIPTVLIGLTCLLGHFVASSHSLMSGGTALVRGRGLELPEHLQTPSNDQLKTSSNLETFNLFGVAGAVDLNQVGDYAFLGNGQSALFLRRANTGTTVRVLQMGDSVPGISGGQIDLLFTPRLNSSAKLAFAADYGTSSNLQRAILIFDGANTQNIVNSADIAPGTGGAIFGRTINLAGITDAGDVAFTGTLIPLNSSAPAQTTLFVVLAGGAPVRTVGPGDPAPGTGGTFTNISLSNAANSLNNGGEVLFTAQIVGGTGGFGLFAGSTSGVRKVVTNGDQFPAAERSQLHQLLQ